MIGALGKSGAVLSRAREPDATLVAPKLECVSLATDEAAEATASFYLEVLGPDGARPDRSRPLSAPPCTALALAAALALHAGIIVAFLRWSFSQAALTPPEPIAVEVVVEASPLASVEAAGAPPATNAPVSPPAVEPPPAEPAEAEPPPLDQAPPPPPVAESPPAAPRAATEAPPPPPVAESPPPAPPAATEAPPPKPANVRASAVRTPSLPPPPKRVSAPAKPAPSAKAASKPAATPAEPVSIARSKPSAKPALGANGAPPAASGAPAASRAAASSAGSAAYQSAVLAAIEAHKHYPEAALGRAARGVAVVTFTIGGGGEVVSAQLARSAGDATLDADAVATVRRTSPFPPPPTGAPRRFAASLNYIPIPR
jgi:protein TonB